MNNKFRGGGRFGMVTVSWPNIVLEVLPDRLIIDNLLLQKRTEVLMGDLNKVEVVTWVPFIARGVRIKLNQNKSNEVIDLACFAPTATRLIQSLQDFGWIQK